MEPKVLASSLLVMEPMISLFINLPSDPTDSVVSLKESLLSFKSSREMMEGPRLLMSVVLMVYLFKVPRERAVVVAMAMIATVEVVATVEEAEEAVVEEEVVAVATAEAVVAMAEEAVAMVEVAAAMEGEAVAMVVEVAVEAVTSVVEKVTLLETVLSSPVVVEDLVAVEAAVVEGMVVMEEAAVVKAAITVVNLVTLQGSVLLNKTDDLVLERVNMYFCMFIYLFFI